MGQKALSWRERMDPEVAGRRHDSDVQKGMGRWDSGREDAGDRDRDIDKRVRDEEDE